MLRWSQPPLSYPKVCSNQGGELCSAGACPPLGYALLDNRPTRSDALKASTMSTISMYYTHSRRHTYTHTNSGKWY